ncbi:MAG: hypothetical protein ACFFBD_26685, partial [Candidatus Hodarchaeota archaeon]
IIAGIGSFLIAGILIVAPFYPLPATMAIPMFPDSWIIFFCSIGVTASICGVLLYIHIENVQKSK